MVDPNTFDGLTFSMREAKYAQNAVDVIFPARAEAFHRAVSVRTPSVWEEQQAQGYVQDDFEQSDAVDFAAAEADSTSRSEIERDRYTVGGLIGALFAGVVLHRGESELALTAMRQFTETQPTGLISRYKQRRMRAIVAQGDRLLHGDIPGSVA